MQLEQVPHIKLVDAIAAPDLNRKPLYLVMAPAVCTLKHPVIDNVPARTGQAFVLISRKDFAN